MASEVTTYTKVNRVHNMEVTTDLSQTNPKNYVALLAEGHEKSTMNLPLKDMVKVYLETPK